MIDNIIAQYEIDCGSKFIFNYIFKEKTGIQGSIWFGVCGIYTQFVYILYSLCSLQLMLTLISLEAQYIFGK